MFLQIRKAAIWLFIASIVIFSLVAILSVWRVFDGSVLSKSFRSLLTITVSLLLIVGAVNWRLGGSLVSATRSQTPEPVSPGKVILYLIIGFIVLSMVIGFLQSLVRY